MLALLFFDTADMAHEAIGRVDGGGTPAARPSLRMT